MHRAILGQQGQLLSIVPLPHEITRGDGPDGRGCGGDETYCGSAHRGPPALIKRIWHVDPLECPRCGGAMTVISFINPWQRDVIENILEHCGLSSRAPPCESRAPPAPPVRELTYVSDLESVGDPGPDEHVWSAD